MEISGVEREKPSPHSNGINGGHSTPMSSRSEDYPTTFVQADTANFKQVVQLLTGSSTDPAAVRGGGGGGGIPPMKSTGQMKKQGFKLYERRNSLKNGIMQINTLNPSRKQPEILSPSILDFPALALVSPATPLNNNIEEDGRSKPSSAEEERAIAEKKFYFHPSPRTGDAPPELLPLFPLTSPRNPS